MVSLSLQEGGVGASGVWCMDRLVSLFIGMGGFWSGCVG